MQELLSKNDESLMEAETWSIHQGWNPLKRLALLQRSVWYLASYLRFQNPHLIRGIVQEELSKMETPSGQSIKEDISKLEETSLFYLTCMASSTEETVGYPLLLALTGNQAETLMRTMARGTGVSCSLVTQLGVPLVEGISMTLTRKDATRQTSSESLTQEDSGAAGRHDMRPFLEADGYPLFPASSPEPAQGESDWAVLMSNMLYTLETDNAGHLRVNGLEYELMPSRTMKEGSERG